MEKSNIVDLDIILRGFREKNGQSAYENLCSKIMSLRPKWFDGDYEKFAAEMIERFENGKYPFNFTK